MILFQPFEGDVLQFVLIFIASAVIAGSAFPQGLVLRLPSSATEGDGRRINAAEVRIGAVATSNVVVTLSSSDSNSVIVPALVSISAGASNAMFDLQFPDNTVTDGARTVFVSVAAVGFVGATNAILVSDNDPHHIRFGAVASPQYAGSNFVVTITVEDIAGQRLASFNTNIDLVAESLSGPVALAPTSVGPFVQGRWTGSLQISALARLVRLRSPAWPGESTPFHVEAQPFRVLPQPTVGIAYRRQSDAVYATVGPNGGLFSNRLIVIDPNALAVTNSFFLGDDPQQLEIAPNGQFLYAAISNRTALRRFDVNSNTPGLQINLGGGFPAVGALHVIDFAIAGGGADQLALSSSDDGGNSGPVRIYSSGVSQPVPPLPVFSTPFIEASPFAPVFYAFENNNSFPFVRFTTSSATATYGLGQGVQFTMRGNIAYTTAGRALNGETFEMIGDYPGASGAAEVDATIRRTFYLGKVGFQYRLMAFDRDSRTPLTSLALPLGGDAGRLFRRGTNGFVFNAGNQIWFVDSNLLVPTNTPADLQITQTLSPSPPILSSNMAFSITVSNAGPGEATFVRVSDTLPSNVTLVSSLASTGATSQIGPILNWDIVQLPPLQIAALTVTVVPNAAGWQTNSIVAWAYEADPTFSNNLSRLPVYVQLPPEMSGAAAVNLLPVEDLTYDPPLNRLLLSMGSGDGIHSNGIALFDPTNGIIESFVNLGARPTKLARSDDGQFLYVSLPDLAVVRRLSLPTLSSNLQFTLGGETIYGSWYPWFAADLAVLPGQPDSIAVSRVRRAGDYATEFHQGVGIFDDGVVRSNVTASCRCTYGLEFANPGTLAASRSDGTIDKLVVDANGVSLTGSAFIAGPSLELSAGGGAMYASAGRVFDPETLQYLGAFSGADLGSAVVADPPNGRVHYVAGTGGIRQLLSFDVATHERVGELLLTNVVGTPSSLVRWGRDGLAFRTTGGQLFVARTAVVSPGATPDLVISQLRSTVSAGTNEVVTLTANVTNAGLARAVGVRFTNALSSATLSTITNSAGSCAVMGGQVVCDLGDLDPNQRAIISVSVLSTSNTVITSLASANCSSVENNLRNNSAFTAVAVGIAAPANALTILNLPVLDLAWDAARNRLLVTCATNVPNWRDTLLSFDANNLAVEAIIAAGPDAARLVAAPDGDRIYVGNYNAIQVFDASSLSNSLNFNLRLSGYNTVAQPRDIAVAPGSSSVAAVVRSADDIALFDNGMLRSNVVGILYGGYRLTFGSTATDLFAQNDYLGGFSRMLVDGSGASLVYSTGELTPVFAAPADLKFSGGLIYNNYGGMIDPQGPTRVGIVPNIPAGTLLALDTPSRRVFYLVPAGATWKLQGYELGTLLPAGSISLGGVSGTPTSLTRCGADGFAFATSAGQLCLLRTSLIPTNPPADLAISVTPAAPPYFVGSDVSLRVTITNAGPNDALLVNWSNALPAGATLVTANASNGTIVTNNTGVSGSLSNLASGASISVDVTFRANSAGLLTSSSSVSSSSIDPSLANNSAAALFWLQQTGSVGNVSVLNIALKDLAKDPIRNRLYLSIGSAAGVLANSILVLDPENGTVLPPIPIGQDPGRLAASADGRFLYVGLDAVGAVRRLNLDTLASDFSFSIPNSRRVINMAVSPTNAELVAIFRDYDGVISAYEHGVARPNELGGFVGVLAFSDLTADLFTCNNGSGIPLYRVDAGPTGVRVLDSQPAKHDGVTDMKFSNGLLYFDSGMVLNPVTRRVQAVVPVGYNSLVESDSPSGRVFYLTPSGSTATLRAIDTQHWIEIGKETVTGISGSPARLLRWGANGFAFRTSGNQLFILRSALAPTNSATDLSLNLAVNTNAVAAGDPLVLNMSITNRGPSAAVSLVVTQGFSLTVTSFLAGASQGSLSNSGSLLTWTLPALGTNQTASCSVTVRLAQTGTLISRAAVRHAGNDPFLANNLDWKTVTVGFSNAVRQIPLNVNELVFDRSRNWIFASVPSTEPFIGNTVIALDPESGEPLYRWYVGSEPNQLALSDGGEFLHVGIDGEMGAGRIDIAVGHVDLKFPFSLTTLTVASDIEVQPGHPETIAAACGQPFGIRVFDAGIARTNGPSPVPFSRIVEFSPEGDWLYGTIQSGYGFGFIRYQVTSEGLYPLPVDQTFYGDDDFEQENGLLYRQSGIVIDPAGPVAVWTNDATGLVAPDATVGRVFYLVQKPSTWEVDAFQIAKNQLTGTQAVAGVQGTPGSLVRCGGDRLAFRTTGGQLFLMHSSLVPPLVYPVDLVVTQSATQQTNALPADRIVFSITVSNGGPGQVQAAQVTDVLPSLGALSSVEQSQGDWSRSGSFLKWQPGAIPAGSSARLEVTITITNTTFFTNIVHCTPDAPDLNYTNNTTTLAFYGIWFQTRDSVRRFALSARDLAYDARRERVFATLSDTNAGNQIVWFDAATAASGGSIALEGLGDRFAISDDSQYLYVSFLGTSLVQRVILASNVVDLSFNLPGAGAPGPFLVLPSHPHSLAAVTLVSNTWLATILDDGVIRGSVPDGAFSLLAASPGGGDLYGYSDTSTGGASPDIFHYQVNSNGLTFVDTGPSDVPWGHNADMAFASDRLYFANGNVIYPAQWREEIAFSLNSWGQLVEINAPASRALFLRHDGYATAILSIFDQMSRRQLEVLNITGVLGGVASLTQCGDDRVAFRNANEILIVRSSQISFAPAANVGITGTIIDSTHTIGNPIKYTLRISNGGPNPASNVTMRLPLSTNFYLGPVTLSQGTTQQTSGFIDCSLATLLAGGVATVSITVTSAIVGTLSNVFSVFSEAIDPVSANNVVTLSTAQAVPQLTINDVQIAEGNVGLTNVVFTVSHNGRYAPPVSVAFATSSGTALASNDFIPLSGTLSFEQGTNTLRIGIPVHGDINIEPNETFLVTLSNPSGASISKAQGVCTILNDDGRPGELYSVVWSALNSVQPVGQPFSATITARDASNNLVSSFNGTAKLRTLVNTAFVANADFETGNLGPWTPLSAGSEPGPYQVVPFDITGNGQLSYAFRLTPNDGASDGIHQLVELRGGISYSFDLDAAEFLESGSSLYLGDIDVHVQASGTEVCGFGFDRFGFIAPNQVFRTNLHGVFLAPTNGLYDIRILITRPWGPYSAFWGLVDNLGITPLNLPVPNPQVVTFKNGIWSGSLQFTGLVDNIWLQADDLNGHIGDSSPFSILQPPLVAIAQTNSAMRLTFASLGNRTYQVQYSTNLINWVSISPAITGTGQEISWSDTGPPSTPSLSSNDCCRFYRLRIVQ